MSFPEYELVNQDEFTVELKPKGANAWVQRLAGSQRGHELIASLEKYEKLARVGRDHQTSSEIIMRAIGLLLTDRLPAVGVEKSKAVQDEKQNEAKP